MPCGRFTHVLLRQKRHDAAHDTPVRRARRVPWWVSSEREVSGETTVSGAIRSESPFGLSPQLTWGVLSPPHPIRPW